MPSYDPDAVKSDLRMLAANITINKWMSPVISVIRQMPVADLETFALGTKNSVTEYCFVETANTALQFKRKFDGLTYSFEIIYAYHGEPEQIHELYAGDNMVEMLYAFFVHCAEQQEN